MKRRNGRSSLLKWLIAIFLLAILVPVIIYKSAGSGERAGNQAVVRQNERAANPWNRMMIDSGLHMLQTGDLVVRTGGDVTSYMLSQLNLKDKTYSHCGIVIREKGYPFVYHSIGGEDNPDQRLRRDSAVFWFSPVHNLGYGIVRYDIDQGQVERVSEVVRHYYKERRKFDLDFDLKTDDRLYCAEFVYKAINEALADSNYVRPVILFGFRYVAVDNLFLNPHARFVWQIQYK